MNESQIRAISLWQPWATLWVMQFKIHETRSWETRFKGSIAVHAAMKVSDPLMELCEQEPFKSALRQVGYEHFIQLPRGVLLGVCDGVECSQIVASHSPLAGATRAVNSRGNVYFPTEQERAFGDWSAGGFAWTPKNMRALTTPIPTRGYQALWNLSADIAKEIETQLARSSHV